MPRGASLVLPVPPDAALAPKKPPLLLAGAVLAVGADLAATFVLPVPSGAALAPKRPPLLLAGAGFAAGANFAATFVLPVPVPVPAAALAPKKPPLLLTGADFAAGALFAAGGNGLRALRAALLPPGLLLEPRMYREALLLPDAACCLGSAPGKSPLGIKEIRLLSVTPIT